MRAWLAIALLGFGACELAEPDPTAPMDGYGPGLGTAENPIPRDSATYDARTLIVRDTAGIPADVASVVASMRAFSQSPGDTMISIAAGADVPELDQLYSSLPSSLSSQLETWIDAQLATVKIGTSSVKDFAAAVSEYTETALTRFGLDSAMSFTPSRATHTIISISFDLGSSARVIVPIGGLKADVIGQQVPVTVGAGGLITFGDHQFGLAFGEHVWQGVGLATTNVFGFDVRAGLVDMIDCTKLAQAIANKCVNGQCVGHQAQLQTVCSRSLDLLVTELDTRVSAFDSDVVRYVTGTARLLDENHDGLANRIADGVWQSELVMGPVRGTFTASTSGR